MLFSLGDRVKDRVSGMEGIVVAHTQWITGCSTYGVRPQGLKDFVPIDAVWLDEVQLELVVSLAVNFGPVVREHGGPALAQARPGLTGGPR